MVVPEICADAYIDVLNGLRDVESPFWAGLGFIIVHAGILALIYVFIALFFLAWQIPVAIITLWLAFEAIHLLGKVVKGM